MSRDALVIGLNKYTDLSNLNNPANDAEAIAQLLETQGGFRVKRLPCIEAEGKLCIDNNGAVGFEELKDAIVRLFKPETDNLPETALLFFAGHGLRQAFGGIGESYLASSDVNTTFNNWGFSLQLLHKLLQRSKIKQQIIWLDCCYSGELLNFEDANFGNRGDGYGRCFIAASREYEEALEQTIGNHGFLTSALLQTLDSKKSSEGIIDNLTLSNDINQSLKGIPQQPVYSNSGDPIIITGQKVIIPINPLPGICPYKGLQYFDFNEEDPKYFFGRTRLTDELIEKIRTKNFLAVLGVSGSGKSSVVRAGLLYEIAEGKKISGSNNWKIYPPFTPAENNRTPLDNLARNFVTPGLSPIDAATEFKRAQDLIAMGAQGLKLLIDAINNPRIIIVIDQFEEIFTRCNETNRQIFFECLLGALADNKLCLVIVMRADFLGKCTEHEYAGLNSLIQENLVTVKPMTFDEFEQAIIEPAIQVKLDIEQDLITQMLKDVEGSPDRVPETSKKYKPRVGHCLPLLQDTLTELWKRRKVDRLTLAEYTQLGGVNGTLKNRADQLYNSLSDEQQSVAKWIFLELTQLGEGTEDTRKQVLKSYLITTKYSDSIINNTLNKLTKARLVVMKGLEIRGEKEKTVTIVDVAHEALIRHWPRLREWLNENRDVLRRRRDIDAVAKEWEANGKSKAYLLHGPKLNTAEDYLNNYVDKVPLANLAQEFINKSIQYRQKKRYIQIGTVTMVIFVLAGIAFYAKKTEQIRTESLFESQLTHASLLAKKGVEDYSTAKTILKQTYKLNKIPEQRRNSRNLLARFVDIRGGTANHTYQVGAALKSVAVSKDGKLLAAAGEKNMIALFDVASGKLIKRLTEDNPKVSIRDLVFDPQGKWLASAGDDKRIIFWSLPSGEKQSEWLAPDRIFALAISPDGTRLATSGTDNQITLLDIETTKVIKLFDKHPDTIYEGGLRFNPTGELLAGAFYDHTARIWEVKTGKIIRILRGHTDDVTSIDFSPDSKLIATSSADNNIMLWKLDSKQPPRILTGHKNVVHDVRFISNADKLISTSLDRTLRIWDTYSGVTIRVLQGHTAGIGEGGLFVHKEQAFSASWDGTVRRWNLNLPHHHIIDLPSEPASVAIYPNGKTIAVGFVRGTIRLYSLPDKRLLSEIKQAHMGIVKRLVFNADGSLLASASSGKIKLWQIKEELLKEQQHFSYDKDSSECYMQNIRESEDNIDNIFLNDCNINAVAFSPDNKILATAGYDGQIGLFTIGTEQKRFIEAHDKKVASVAFDNSGTRLLSTGMYDYSVRLWNIKTDSPTLLKTFPVAQDKLMWTSISPDNKKFVSVGRGSLAAIYSTKDGQKQHHLVGHQQTVIRAIFSQDSQQVATLSGDTTVRMWDLKNRNELFTLPLPANTGRPYQVWDFDFHCADKCWIAVPLTRGKLVLYDFGKIYN